ncbi:MAG: hypothetical protein K2Y29_06955 [Beijerinckiaceae bacterium]|nr:hypothetical protein [Beijerinckiaceae bacterium]
MKFALALVAVLTPVAASANRAEGDACAAGLSAESQTIYRGTLASNPTPQTARDIVKAQTEKLISEGKLSMFNARSAAQAAGKCLELAGH